MEAVICPGISDICDTFGDRGQVGGGTVASVQTLARDICDTSAGLEGKTIIHQWLNCSKGKCRKCPSRVRHLKFERDFDSSRQPQSPEIVPSARGTTATVSMVAALAAVMEQVGHVADPDAGGRAVAAAGTAKKEEPRELRPHPGRSGRTPGASVLPTTGEKIGSPLMIGHGVETMTVSDNIEATPATERQADPGGASLRETNKGFLTGGGSDLV